MSFENTGPNVSDDEDAFREPRPLSDEIYDRLLGELISLRLSPQTRLSVDRLAKQFDVSQTPVRAALIRLEAEGLVVRKHNTGFSVAPLPSRREFQEMYLMRALLEPEVAALAASNARLVDTEKLRGIYDSMTKLVSEDVEANYGKFALLDGQYHDHLALISGNELIRRTLDMIHVQMQLFRLHYHASVAHKVIEEHLEVLIAIEQRNPEAAKLAMARHIEASRTRAMPHYSRLGWS